jgi:hypothetical protein
MEPEEFGRWVAYLQVEDEFREKRRVQELKVLRGRR